MNPCSARALWIASATALTSLSLTASLIANAWLPHRQLLPKPDEKPRPELLGDMEKMQLRSFTRTFYQPRRRKHRMPLRGALLDEFGRHEEIYPNDRAPIRGPTPRSSLDEFPAGYSLTRCSPAELVSASPAGVEYASGITQLRGLLLTNELEQPIQHDGGSILIHPFFCPNNGVHPTHQLAECQPIGITQVRELPNPFSDSEIRLGTPKSVL